MLRIQLLGSPLILYNEKPMVIRRLLPRALLFYLACQQSAVGRSTLTFLFWPEKPEEQAREHLRDVLSKLRTQLPEPDVLVTYMDTVQLDLRRVWVDVLEFERLIHQARPLTARLDPDQPLPHTAYEHLTQAVRLWRGDSFLAGVQSPDSIEYEHWLTSFTQELHQSYQYALETLGKHSMKTGNLDVALEWWRLALQSDELNDWYHSQYLICLQKLGRIREALEHCARAQALFVREMQDVPESLLNVCQSIRQQASDWKVENASAWTVSLGHQSPFIGRKELLNELKTMLLMSGGAAALVGESGIGKTRLIYELYHSLQNAPRLVLARGRAMEHTLPFQPLIDAMRQFVHKEEWDALGEPWRLALGVLLPELAADVSFEQQEEIGSRSRLFEAIFRLLGVMAGKQRILFFLDDAHWCDEATLEALAYSLERGFFTENGLLVLALQSEQTNPYLEQFLAHFQRAGLLSVLALEGLTQAEVGELSRRVLGRKVSIESAERLTRDSGGNPLLLLETLHSALRQSEQTPLQAATGHLSQLETLRALLHQRLQSLSGEERELLSTAAVIGDEFSLDTLATALKMDATQIATIIHTLERMRLIHPVPGTGSSSGIPESSDSYAFNHGRVREALLLELGPARRRAIHLRVAKALEENADPLLRVPAILARHFEEGGEYHRAFRYWLEAASHARRLHGRREAYEAFRLAERLLIRLGYAMPESDIYRLYSEWGELAGEAEDLPVLEHISSAVEQIGNRLRSPLLLGLGLMNGATLWAMNNQLVKGLTVLNRALTYLERAGNQYELVHCYYLHGILHAYLNLNQKASADLERALHVGGNSTDARMRRAMVDARIYLSLVYYLRGWPEEGFKQAERALRESRQMMYFSGIARSKLMAARSLIHLGRYSEAVELCQLGIQRAEIVEDKRTIAQLHLQLGVANTALGRLDESWQHLQTAVQMGKKHSFVDVISEGLCIQGELFRLLGATEQAITCYEQGASFPESFYTLDNRYRLGLMLMLSGAYESGLELVQRSMTAAEQADLGTIYLAARLSLAFSDYQRGKVEQAQEAIQSIALQISQRGYATMPATVEIIRFEYAVTSGDFETAQTCVQKVIAIGQGLPNVWVELWGQRLAYRLARQSGENPEPAKHAIEHLLDEIGKHAHHADLLPLYQKFRTVTLETLSNYPNTG